MVRTSGERSNRRRIGRRTYLATAAGVGAAAIAGCSSGSGDGNGGNGGDGGDGNGDGGSVPAEVSDYLSNTSNFDGSLSDLTGQSEVTVEVGAEGNGNFWAFAPAAIRISTGTTVTWEWTGQGGSHNVVAEDEAFESEYHNQEGATFEHTFQEAGTFLYKCIPHESSGMKGAVVVE